MKDASYFSKAVLATCTCTLRGIILKDSLTFNRMKFTNALNIFVEWAAEQKLQRAFPLLPVLMKYLTKH